MLSYTLHGSGPVHVITAHSWLTDSTGFTPLLPHLSPEAFTVALVDARGFGGSLGQAGAHSIDEWAADLLEVADELGWRRFAVVGHSMGGKLTQHLLATSPERLTAAVGIAPVPASAVPLDTETRTLMEDAAGSADLRRAIIASGTGTPASEGWLSMMVGRSVATSTPAAFGGYFRAWADADVSAPLAGSEVPTLIIAGAEDPSAGPAVVEATWLRSQPSAGLHVLPGVGHYPLDEATFAVGALLSDFLSTSARV